MGFFKDLFSNAMGEAMNGGENLRSMANSLANKQQRAAMNAARNISRLSKTQMFTQEQEEPKDPEIDEDVEDIEDDVDIEDDEDIDDEELDEEDEEDGAQPAAPAPASDGLSQRLNMLIEAAVTDGQISDAEMRVLVRKGAAEGFDEDEMAMLVEARLFEHNKKAPTEAAAQPAAAAPRKAPTKCPHCGAPIVSLTTKCPDCGYEYTDDGIAVSPWNQLLNKLEEIDRMKDPKGKRSFFDTDYETVQTNMKVQTITNFPVPETKKGIVEFFTYCAPQAKKKGFFNEVDLDAQEIKHAYYIKAQQVLTRARFMLKDEPNLLAEIEATARRYKIKA